jgi:hypothetical protein
MDLVGGEEKADALSGIALVEKLGMSFSSSVHLAIPPLILHSLSLVPELPPSITKRYRGCN